MGAKRSKSKQKGRKRSRGWQVAKVDIEGRRISSIKNRSKKELYFDSKLEWEIWKYLKDNNISFQLKPKKILFGKIKALRLHKQVIEPYTVRAITYTPDFYLPDYDVYLEVKGWATPVFKLKWKLFLIQHVGFMIYSLDELVTLLNLLSKTPASNA